jgi:hypothetical protein
VQHDRIAENGGSKRARDGPAERFERFVHDQRSMVEVRRIFFCNNSTP